MHVTTPLCPTCASPVPPDARTCPTCGTPLVPVPNTSDQRLRHDYALPPGTWLDNGNFSIGKVLGHGGFGITYLGADLRRARPIALKEFFPAGAGRQGLTALPPPTLRGADYQAALERFLDEGRVLARFHHPGIVDVYGVFQANATAYMAMEYLRGPTLGGRLEAHGGPLPEPELLATADGVTAALEAIHREGFLHRDIKPDNIILAEGGSRPRPVLIDFGATREFAGNKTLRQSVVLTPGYAPLEQYAQQARRGPFTDIYALAATLYHLATGEQPPAATDRAMGVELKPPRVLNPKLSVTFDRALVHGLAMAIDQRPQSARAFYRELAGLPALLGEDGPPAAPPAPAPRPSAPPLPPPPPALPGHLGRVRTIARTLRGDGTATMTGELLCPVCRGAAMHDPAADTGPVPCPVCRAADLREQVPDAARGHCPSCHTGIPLAIQSTQVVPGTLLRCPACRVGAVVQYARPGSLLLPDIWARCDTCGADFDYHLQGDRMTLDALPNGPGQLDPALRGRTLTRSEWRQLSGRTETLYFCENCAAEIDIYPDDERGQTLEWVAVDGSLDRVPPAYRGRRCTPLELDKAAAGIAPDAGSHACPHCRAQFDAVARDELVLLRAPDDPHGLVARFGGRAHAAAFWRSLAAGKRDPARPGLICPACTAELATGNDDSYGLVAYDPRRDPYGIGGRFGETRDRRGTYLASGDWRRLAAGQPVEAEARSLRDEANREFWLALLAGEVSLVGPRDYPDRLAGDEVVVLALATTRYRRTWVSDHPIDTGTLWVTTRHLRYRGERGEATIPLATICEWSTERWDGGTATERDAVTLRRSDGEKDLTFSFRPAEQIVEATVDGLSFRVRLDADHLVALCESLRQNA